MIFTDCTISGGVIIEPPPEFPYGTKKAIFGYGSTGTSTAITNLVSSTGVVANDVTGVGTARRALAAAIYSS